MTDRTCLRASDVARFVDSIVESSPYGIIVVDSDLQVSFWNQVVSDWTGVEQHEAIGERIDAILPEFARKRYALRLQTLIRHGTPVVFHDSVNQGLLTAAGGDVRLPHYRITCHRLRRDEDAFVVFWIQNTSLLDETIGYLQDEIAARRRAEAEVESAARSHEILYRELQHRVKNTLSLISSLVSLSMHSTDLDSASALAEIETRIESIVLVYNQLAARSRYGELDLSDYLRALTASILSSLVSPPGMEDPEIRLDSVIVSVDSAISIGLIVNELMTNSVKHAFGHDSPGRIRVRLAAGVDEFELEVSDNGVGRRDDAADGERESGSLGLGIVELLAEQIGADLEPVGPPGTGHRLRVRQDSLPNFPQVE